MFILVSRRYERASLIVTSNKPFRVRGSSLGSGDTRTAVPKTPERPAAMCDRLRLARGCLEHP
jgi:hypothetical protein